jgi:hypothetical protein
MTIGKRQFVSSIKFFSNHIPSITVNISTKIIDELYNLIYTNSSQFFVKKKTKSTYFRTVKPDFSIQPNTNAVLEFVEHDIKHSRCSTYLTKNKISYNLFNFF